MGAALERVRVHTNAAILFPSSDAEQLETMPPELYPSELIVVDGTWSHAKTLLRDVPELRRFRRLKFSPRVPSTYRIRKEPRADYLSTIESIAYVLRLIEPETEGLTHLEQSFSEMIDRNIAARRPSDERSRFQRRKRNLSHRFSPKFHVDPERFVVAYCEGTSRFAKRSYRSAPAPNCSEPFQKEPLVIYMKRPATGESLRVLLRTDREPPARLLAHLSLSLDDLECNGVTRARALDEIRRWLKDDDVTVVWNASSRQILDEVGFPSATPLILKGAFCDYLTYLSRSGSGEEAAMTRAWGGMENFIARLALQPPTPEEPGRGPLRLAQTETLLGWIQLVARANCDLSDN